MDGGARKALTAIKNILKSDEVMIFQNFKEPFVLATDASHCGLSWYLQQMRENQSCSQGGHSKARNATTQLWSLKLWQFSVLSKSMANALNFSTIVKNKIKSQLA